MTGRGCPFHCAFCHEGIGKGVRLRSVENILSEIDAYLTKWESDELYITFTDDTFTLNAKRLKKICDGIKSRSQNGCVLHFFCEGHIHTLYQHPEMIKYLAESGCQRLQLGIEAGTDEILKVYGKNSTVEEIFEVVRLCCEYGIKQVYGNIILGSAFFNEKIFEADKKFVKELLFVGKGVIEIGVVTFWALPNTQMTMHPEKFGMKI
ncbi:MAG: radical SAM protein, partial [Alphaproteobacteria bacterium]|nr:radical SAM protein [Alphaproteobacteria bacterium]